ncbi:lipopolysaccharide biosynthesis protein [Pedococcus bigeumensis]|uniref:lipopolysaccharide biosynthesis protein n=1 Tax=Pedococcus bigeumensis TaxID=433644 RepID=UPI002FED74AC
MTSSLGDDESPDVPTVPMPHASTAMRTARHGAIYAVASVAPVLTAVIITPGITRALGPAEYGVVATHLVIIQTLSLLATLGLPGAITRHALIEQSGLRGAARLVWQSAGVAGAVAVLGALTSPLWVSAATARPWSVAAGFAVLGGAALSVTASYQAFVRARYQPWRFVAGSAALSIVAQASGLLLARQQHEAAAYLLGLSAAYLAVLAVMLVDLARQGRTLAGRANRASSDLKDALLVGLPTVPHSLALLLVPGAVVLLANRTSGSHAAGQLQLILLVGSAPALALGALNNAWAPTVYGAREGTRGDVVATTSRLMLVGVCVLSLVTALLSPIALRILAPESFLTGAPIWSVSLVVATSVPTLVYLCNVHLVFSSGRTSALAWLTPINLAVATLAGLLLRHVVGLAGLTLIPLVFYSLQAAALAIVRRRVSRERWSERSLLVIAGAAIAMLSLTGLLPTSPSGYPARILLTAALVLVCLMARRRALAHLRGMNA